LSQWLELSRWVHCTGRAYPTTHVTSGVHGPKNGPREFGVGGVDPPLAGAALD